MTLPTKIQPETITESDAESVAQDTTNGASPHPQPHRGGKTAWPVLHRPDDDATTEEWLAYRAERHRRKVLKAERRGRIARRESPHDPDACKFCKAVKDSTARTPRTAQQIADRSMVCVSTVYRVLQTTYDKKNVRGRRSLTILRRIAHDGMGISLDELAALILD